MGSQEVFMVMGKAIGGLLTIWLIASIAASVFINMQNASLANDKAIKADIVASSMDIIQMHTPSEINMEWDYTPFLMATTDGALLTLFFENKTIVSPYPLILPIDSSVELGDANYLVGNRISEFKFSNFGTPEVKVI